MMKHILLFLLILCVNTVCAQNDSLQVDTLAGQAMTTVRMRYEVPCKAEHRFQTKQIIAPAVLLTAGAVGVGVKSWREEVKKGMADLSGGHALKIGDKRVDDYIQYIPLLGNLFLGCAGVHSKHRIGDRALITATAFATEAVLVNGIKYTVREKRPDSGARNSFPSGHTATVFTGAELARLEYGWDVGGPMYAIAVATGFLRVYHERHWYNDVLAGAGIGILSANVANWLYPLERRVLTPKKRRNKGASLVVVPTFEYNSKSAGVVLAAIL